MAQREEVLGGTIELLIDGLHVSVDDGALVGTRDATKAVKAVPAPTELMVTFVNLAKKTDRQLAVFARKWGMLGLDKRGVPTQLAPRYECRESADHWRKWSACAAALLDVAGSIHERRGVSPEQRKALADAHLATGGRQLTDLPEPGRGSAAADSMNVGLEVNRWLHYVGTAFEFRWDVRHGPPELAFRPPNLFGVLALQIASAVTRAPGYRMCKGPKCRQWFTPRHGNQKWCRPCVAAGKDSSERTSNKRTRDAASVKRQS